jgi:acid stress-induced BolA-like protein IbaG/YrbA
MTLPVWPTSLPDLKGEASTFQATMFADGVVTTQFDDGPDMARNRKLYDDAALAMSLYLDRGQLTVFKAFVKNDLNRGVARFTGPVVTDDGTTSTKICRIAGPVTIKAWTPEEWAASFNLTVMEW